MGDKTSDLLKYAQFLLQLFQATADDVLDEVPVLLFDHPLEDHGSLVRVRREPLPGAVETGLDLQRVLHRRFVLVLLHSLLRHLEMLLGAGHVQALLLSVLDEHLGDADDLRQLVLGQLHGPLGGTLGGLESGQEHLLLDLLPCVIQLFAQVRLDHTQPLDGVDPLLGQVDALLHLCLGVLVQGVLGPLEVALGRLEVLLVGGLPSVLQVLGGLGDVDLMSHQLTDVL